MTGSRGGGAVQALMLEASQAHVVADYIQHPHHLTEDQHPAKAKSHSAECPIKILDYVTVRNCISTRYAWSFTAALLHMVSEHIRLPQMSVAAAAFREAREC